METGRFLLRPWNENDAETLFKYASDPEVGPRAGWPPHKSVEESRSIITNVFSSEGMWAVEWKESGEAIGCVGYLPASASNLLIRENECEVGYWIARPFWGKGICTEALQLVIDYCFHTKGYKTIWGDYFPDNPASGRVLKKCGFVDTGQEVLCPNLKVGADSPVKVMKLEKMDIEHHFVEKGAGEPLILLHGNGEDSSYFSGQIDVFAQYWHVYALDTRGHGQTPRGKQPFTIRQFAEDLLGFMDAHHIGKAHILGFSDGGNIAMVFAMKYPERVGRLILDGANLYGRGVKSGIQVPIVLGYGIAKLCGLFSSSARSKAEMLGLMVNDPHIHPEELAAIQARTLVMAGTDDMIKEKHTKLIAESIPRARMVILEGSHFVANEHPKAFNEAVLAFMQEV